MSDYSQYIISKDDIFKNNDGILDADFSRYLKTERVAAHWVVIPAGDLTSYPHAESHEEEFIYVFSGRPHIWINGYIYQLEPGMCVGFKAGTGIAHNVINNTDQSVELIVMGERTKDHNKCAFPVNPEFKKSRAGIWWDECPPQELGPHDGKPGNLNHQKNISKCPFIQNVYGLERQGSFSYRGDKETFTEGIRLTNKVDLVKLGIWHELAQPGKRTSFPHAHKVEEEFAVVLKGQLQVWMNGELHNLKSGDAVFFKPNTNIAHVIINNSDEPAEYLMLGESTLGDPKSDRINYPLNQARNEQCVETDYFWTDMPIESLKKNDLSVPLLKDVKVVIEKDVNSFLNTAQKLLYKDEAEYNLLLGLSLAQQRLGKNDYQYFGIYQNEQLMGCAIITEINLVITNIPEPILQKFAEFLVEKNITFPGIVGPSMTSTLLSRIYSELTGKPYKLGFGQKIYSNSEVIPARATEGKVEMATIQDVETIAKWLVEFTSEALPNELTTIEKARKSAEANITAERVYVWRDQNGNCVSMNFVGRPTNNGITLNAVYTPPLNRKRGYASALVAATTQKMLESGKKFCALYTDSANPTSNKIYQDIGYKEVAGSKQFIFR